LADPVAVIVQHHQICALRTRLGGVEGVRYACTARSETIDYFGAFHDGSRAELACELALDVFPKCILDSLISRVAFRLTLSLTEANELATAGIAGVTNIARHKNEEIWSPAFQLGPSRRAHHHGTGNERDRADLYRLDQPSA